MKQLSRIIIPLLILLVVIVRWSRSSSRERELAAGASNDTPAQMSARLDANAGSSGSGAPSSSQRRQNERLAAAHPGIADIDEFTEQDLVHEHVIHTIVPRGSSVVVAGERDAQGKRIFTIFTPESGDPEWPRGQIKLSARNYALDDQQIDQAGMQTLLGNEPRLHNLGEIWSPEDINNTQAQWPADAALSMPAVMLESGAEGMIEIGTLGKSSELFRTKVQVHETAAGFELKTKLQTFRRK